MTDVVLLRVDRAPGRRVDHPRHRAPPLDLKYVEAQLVAKSVAVRLIDGWLSVSPPAALEQSILTPMPRLVVLHALSWSRAEAVDLATRLRGLGVVTVAVGQQVADQRFQPRPEWAAAYDLSCGGEPEEALAPIILRLLAGEPVSRIVDSLPGSFEVEQPDQLAPPRWSSAELARYPFPFPLLDTPPLRRWGYLISAWGCPRSCRHCSVVVRKSSGRRLRGRDPALVADEALRLREWGADALSFEDDSLFVDRQRLMALADALIGRGAVLPWMANARPDEFDPLLFERARASGMRLLKVGIDSAIPRLIESIGKSRNGERWIEQGVELFDWLRARGVTSVALLMVGLPGGGDEEEAATRKLLKRLQPDYLQIQLYRPYPDSLLARAGGSALQGDDYHYPVGPMADGAGLVAMQQRIYRHHYLNPRAIARHLWRCRRFYFARGGDEGVVSAIRYLLRRR